MHLSKRVKVVAGVSALLGVVVAGGAAFTATGVSTASQPAAMASSWAARSLRLSPAQCSVDINYGYPD